MGVRFDPFDDGLGRFCFRSIMNTRIIDHRRGGFMLKILYSTINCKQNPPNTTRSKLKEIECGKFLVGRVGFVHDFWFQTGFIA